MNRQELESALRKLRLSGMVAHLDPRTLEAQTDNWPHLDFLGALAQDELQIRQDRLLKRRITQARFRDPEKTLDGFDFAFNPKTDKKTIWELSSARFVDKRKDALFLGPPGTGKSHVAQAIGYAAILQGHRVLYRETHILLEELADASLDHTRKDFFQKLFAFDLLVIDDLGMKQLGKQSAEDLLEVIMRRYERKSTLLTSNRPVEDWGKVLGDNAATTALLDRLLHHAYVVKFGPKSYRLQQARKRATA